MGLLGLDMGKVTRVRKNLVGSAVFLKLVRPLDLSDPACAENRVIATGKIASLLVGQAKIKSSDNAAQGRAKS